MLEVMSGEVRQLGQNERRAQETRRERTGVESGWDGVEHVRVHVGVDRPVGRRVVARGNQDRVPLCDCHGKQVDWELLNVSLYEKGVSAGFDLGKIQGKSYTVNLNDTHVVAVDPEEEHREGRSVHDTQAVRLAWLSSRSYQPPCSPSNEIDQPGMAVSRSR